MVGAVQLCVQMFPWWMKQLTRWFYICSSKHDSFHEYIILLYEHQWNTKWAFPRKLHIFTHEDNMLSSHVKRSLSLWLHNKSRLWKQVDLVFQWCLYNKLVRYRVDHLKIKFMSIRGHVISSIYPLYFEYWQLVPPFFTKTGWAWSYFSEPNIKYATQVHLAVCKSRFSTWKAERSCPVEFLN